MKKGQKINEKGINHQNTPKILELSLASGSLRDFIVHYSNEINQFSKRKRTEIEWLPLGSSNGVQVDFIDRKTTDKKDDKFLLFKNINIPSIKVKDANLQCQTALFFSFRKAENEDQLRQIELKTKSNAFPFDLSGDCMIQHIRFKETSFHHHGEQFQLIIALKNYNNELISAFVSSPFLVESRKKPFQERAHKEQNISTLYDPFLPSILEKQYNIQGTQTDCASKSNKIGEDLKSLIIYFSAQNIRHKIIHPLYLLFKFPEAISLFYNKNIIPEENITPERLIRQIQQKIFQILLSDSNQNEFSERLLILCLNSNKNNVSHTKDLFKVSKYMSFLEGPALTFLEKTPSDLPPEFKLMNNIEDLKIAYSKVYSEIAKLKIEMKMRQEKELVSYHSIIERRGGIPVNEQIQQLSPSIEQESSNNSGVTNILNKKNIFHHICYDLQIRDSSIKSTLLKIPVEMISIPLVSKKESQMEIELNPKKKQSNFQIRTNSNSKISIYDSHTSEQKSDHKIFQEDEDREESISLNSIRREIEQLNAINKQKQSCEYTPKLASFRCKKQNENQIQVVFQCQESTQKELQESSYLIKRRNHCNSENKQQKSQNGLIPKEEKMIEKLPQKKRKLQNNIKQNQFTESVDVDVSHNSKKQQPKQNKQQKVDIEESIISGKIENLHLGKPLKHFNLNKKIEIKNQQTEIEKKEQQGNTSSTASTINTVISKLDHGHHKNSTNNFSSSSSSAVNKNPTIYKRNSNISQSSSDTQNNKNELISMNDEVQQDLNIISLNVNYNNKNIHNQNKMEIEYLYEQLQQETTKNKQNNSDSKASQNKFNDQMSMLNGYESDLSQQNDEIENQNSYHHTQNPQNRTSHDYKMQQYLKGYDNDDEFDYQNEEDEDGDLSLEQLTNKQIKYSSFQRNDSNNHRIFQSSSSLHSKLHNPYGNEIKLQKKDQQQKRNKHPSQGKKSHAELLKLLLNESKKHQKTYQSCDENQSNMIED